MCARTIEGTLELVRRHDIKPGEVVSVEVAVQESCYKRESMPFDPQEGTAQVKAQFSIDYCVAAAVLWRDVFIREMQDERIFDPRVLDMTRRVKVSLNPEKGRTQYLPVTVAVTTQRGTFTTHVSRLKGSPEDPLTCDEIVSERLARCAPHSAVVLPRENLDELIAQCRELRDCADVRRLVHLITPGAA